MPNDAMNFGVDLLPITDATYNLGDSDHKWNIFGDVTGTAESVTTTADTSSTLYLIGVTSSATDTLKRDTSLTMKGGRLTAATGLTVSNSSGADRHLEFSRSTYNYISIPSGSELCIFGAASSSSSCTTTASIRIGVTASSNNVTAGFITPGVTNKMNLGASNLKWATVYATTFSGDLSGNATTASSSPILANSKGTYGTGVNISSDRYTNANIDHVTNGGVVHFKSTSAMSGDNSNKPMGDGNILHFHWDTADGWDSQLYIPDSGSWHMQWRGHTNKTTWQTGWNTLLDDKNYQEYAGIEIIRLAT